MVKIKKQKTNKQKKKTKRQYNQVMMQSKGTGPPLLVKLQTFNPLWRLICCFLIQLKIVLLKDPVI